MKTAPSYIALWESGQLAERSREARELLASCVLCPRGCRTNRLAGETGFCRTGLNAVISSYNAHHGEEPPISGSRGSGTIFFSNCNLSCVYCQNWPISQMGQGREVTPEGLAGMMMELQGRGCHNVNFVTPSHVTAQIVEALELAVPMGFRLPLVYNSSGYDSLESLRLLDGVIDIYLPDIRYSDSEAAGKYSGAPGYPAANREALKEMWRQAGPLVTDGAGMARRGMIVRHLVLPNNLSQTRDCLEFLSREISSQVHLSLMSQYFPGHRAQSFPELSRHLDPREYQMALEWADELGLENGWRQELDDSGGGPPGTIIRDE
jgi:putative pyruvate formate lyase activating enzyme